MLKFFYVVRNSEGKKITGSEEASSSEELISRLQSRDLIVIEVIAESNEAGRKLESRSSIDQNVRQRHSRVTSGDLVVFCRQLSTLLSAGVTILKSLEITAQQISSRKLYSVIKDVKKNMEAGLSFHETLAKHTDVFSELWINLIESGEASGNLSIVLNRLASYLERKEAFKGKMISSIIYPVILLLAGTGALLFLTIKIVPTFAEIFKGFNVELPFLTRILVSVSTFMRKYILIIFGILIAIFFIIKGYIKTREGRKAFEKIQFSLPVFGEFFRALAVERFSSGMATLIESGVPLLYSLDISEHSVGSIIVGDIVRQIKEEVREGRSLSQPLAKSGFFEPMVVQMVAVGEEIGDLPQMFKRINQFYQEYVETFLTRFTAMFEPFMLIFMGAVIGTMVIGMFLPIFQLAQLGK